MDTITSAQYITRFSRFRIAEHWFAAAIFILLMVTGFAQKYNEAPFAQWLVLNLGGIDAIRMAHRIAGSVLVLTVAQHILAALSGVLLKGWDTSTVITRCDFSDAITNLKYYFGMVASPAACDRYNYRQKFEYWGLLTGSIIMIVTGVALWFPTTTTSVFPGVVIPLAKLLHTSEAMVLVLLIAVWHVYNAIFSPEVFPMDTVMLTGKISKERMIREHPKEYERLCGMTPGLDPEELSPPAEQTTGHIT